MNRTTRILSALLIAACVLPLAAQQHPNVQKGFAPERAYQMAEVDNVNLFNGNLVVQIPIGQKFPVGGNLSYNLTLTHNSKLWDYQRVIRSFPTTATYLRPIPSRRSNAGFGWLLSLGRILLPENPVNDGGQVVYESPDGSEHVIYKTLHEGEPPPSQVPGTNYVQGYTRDGTYLRMRSLANGDAEMEFPDGNVHLFREIGITGLLRPIELRDRFGNTLKIDYSSDNLTWTLTDSHNRKTYVYFKSVGGQTQDNYKTAVDRIDMPKFNGGRAIWTFVYSTQSISRACVPTGSTVDPQAPSSQSLNMLQGVRLPTGESWDFSYFSSHNACGMGAIRTINTPTGGQMEYEYQLYRLPAAGCREEAFNESNGILTRKITNPATNEVAIWRYDTDPQTNFSNTGWTCTPTVPRQYQYAPSEELKNTITKPNGDRIVNYFSIWPERRNSNFGFKRDEYGLPFTRRQPSGDRFLSSTLSGNGKTTSTYVKYEVDGDPDFIEPLAPMNVDKNRRVAGTKTVYDDGKFADVAYSSFDGLGNYRTATTSGSFGAANTRTTTTTYNPSTGEYKVDASGKAMPGYNFPGHGANWILNTYTSRTVTEGASTLKSEFCFDGSGLLKGRRIMEAAGGSNDVVVVYDHVKGNVTSEKYFGGDVNPTASSGCAPTGVSKYEIVSNWDYGSVKNSKHNGTSFFDVDNDLDLSTGLVSTSRDRSGISTSFTYDALGRLLTSTPQSGQGAATSYTYTTDRTSPTIDIVTTSAGRQIDRKYLRFDSLGRLWAEFQFLPTGSWNAKVTRYDSLGRIARESQREPGNPFGVVPNPANWTSRTYDYLGRELIVTPPDGDRHKIEYRHQGISQTTETVSVGDGSTERLVTVTREYDRQGRISEVTEPSGPGGGSVRTTYEYDAADRLRKVTMFGEATQTRTFTYDGRGFLTQEKHPEFDGGAIDYADYDALGHPGRKSGGGSGGSIVLPGQNPPSSDPFDLTFTYDVAERLTHVRNFGSLVKEFIYDTAAGFGKGKVATAKRYQTVDGIGSVPVTETYVYSGVGGRVSKKTTAVGTLGSFEQSYTYTDLGQELTITYPNCLHTGCKETSPSRTITNAYSANNSWLTAVNGYAPAISYHVNAEVAEVSHENGVKDTQGLDPNMIARPASITFSGFKQPPPCTKPTITTQPPAAIGGPDKSTVQLTVAATGSEPLRYQWFLGTSPTAGEPIAGATDATYAVTILFRQATFWVEVSNACGTVKSNVVTVKSCPLAITTQPETKVVAKNDPASFSVAVANTQGTVSYQWYEGASGSTAKPVAGATSSSLTIPKALADASYWVRVTDSCAQVDSEAAKLIVGAPCLPVITKHPQSTTVIIPDFTVLRVESTTTTNDKLSWQWYEGEKSDTSKPLNGAQAPSVSVRPSKSTKYWVRVFAKCGSVDSEAALVCVLPNVTINPFSQTVAFGQVVNLTFQHGFNAEPVTYQWYEGERGDTSTPIADATEKSLLITSTFTAKYWARISNHCGFNDTNAAKICVLPNITKQPAATVREAGKNVTLSVQATGGGLVYQWYEGPSGDKSRPIANATQATVIVAPTATTKYWVLVSNECGGASSQTAEVRYCEPPAVTKHPVGGTLSPGQAITLTADFTGTDLTYRWYANGSAISFGTSKELFVAPQYSTSYTCTATNGCGSVTTQPAHVAVCGPPVILQQPAATTYVPPNTAGTISVVVGGSVSSYQWYEGVTGDKSKPIQNGNGPSLTVPSRATSYWVHLSSGCGETSSITAYVKACAAPGFIATSSSYSITLGQAVTLSVKNLVNGPVTVQWYDGVTGDTSRPVGNGESVQLQPQQTTNYWVRVTNACTSIDYNVGKVDVCIPPRILQGPARETTITWKEAATLTAVARGSVTQWTWYQGSYNGSKTEVGTGQLNGTGTISLIVKPDTDKQYSLTLNNQCGGDSSGTAIVWVRNCGEPTISRQPESVTIDVGREAFLYVAASSASRYQWYIGDTGDTSKPIAGANFSSLVVSPGATTRYWVKASNMCGDISSSTAVVGVRGSCVPPVITQQPYFAYTLPGTPVKLNIEALSGAVNTTYQWYTQDGQPVAGATSPTLTVAPSVNTTYYAVVTNACGSDTSSSTTVFVNSACIAPTITEQPQPTSTSAIEPATLSVRASGTWPLTYQWYHDTDGGAAVLGATDRTLQVPITASTLAPYTYMLYHVTVKNACGQVSSYSTKVQLERSCAPPKFTLQPKSATIDPGKGAVLSVAAEGGSPINFYWYTQDGQPVPNTFGSTTSITVNPTRTTSYYIIARGSCGFAYSDTATITVNAPCATPVVTDQPRSSTIVRGNPVTLTATAAGTAPITWQWFNGDGSPIAGATSPSYTTTPAQTSSYYAIASNACGTVQTSFAVVTVKCDAPFFTQLPQSVTVNAGQPATLTAQVNPGSAATTYQWYTSDGTPVAGQTSATMTIAPAATTIYYLEATNLCGTARSQLVTITICEPVKITQEPQDVTVDVGQIFSLFVTATGTGPLQYQWFTGSGAPLNAFSAGYSAGIVEPKATTLTYYVQVKGACGTVRSRTATVTVNCPKPAFTQQPQNATIVQGQSTTLSVAFTTGGLSYSIAWYTAAGTKVGEGNSITVSPQSTTSYYAVVTNGCGPTNSDTVTVTVSACPKPVITQQPQNVTFTPGQPVTLSVGATSEYSPLTYQWYNAGNLIAGATSATYTIADPPPFTTTYYVVVTNSCNNSIQSNTVTVCSAPTIVTQPQDVTVDVGQIATLSVVAGGAAPYSYQWYTGNGVPLTSPGANNSAISFGFVEPSAPVTYYVVVTNACGTVRSRTATVTVNCPKPSIVTQPQSSTINAGQFATLGVAYNTTTASSVSWYTSGGAKIGEGTPFSFQPAATASYYGVISNTCGTTTTSTVTITVNAACNTPVITAQPQSASIVTGQSATLSVTATSSQTMSYQWYANGSPVAGATSSTLTVSPASTTSYYAIVSNSCGATQSSTATISLNCPLPAITGQPQSATITAGQSTTLSVTASSSTPVTYQWYRANAQPVSGGTSTSLVVSPAATTTYYVVVTNSCGSATSNVVTVTVGSCAAPAITSQPQSVSISAGQSTTLSVTASSSSAVTYQWFNGSGTPVSGGTSSSLTVSPASTTSYYVVVTNSCGATQSSTATVTIAGCSVPTITSQPQSAQITPGSSTTLAVTVSSSTAVTYQWYSGQGVPVPGGTSRTLTVSPSVTTQYYVTATNSCGARTSVVVTVTVEEDTCVKVVITQQPEDVTIQPGGSATLSVSASGDAPITYEWFYSTGAPVGTGRTLTVSPSETTRYYVVVSNACQILASRFATVTVECNAPTVTAHPWDVTITEGQTTTLSVAATGTGPLSYEWQQFSGGRWVSAGSGMNINVGGPAGTYSYRAVVTNSCGQDISDTATVTINSACVAPHITQQPQDPNFTETWQSATISVGATGSNLTYRWYQNGSEIGSGPTLTIYAQMSTITYYAVVSNDCGSETSASIVVESVCKPPDVTIVYASDPVVGPGGSSVLGVNSSGTPFLHWTLYEQPVGGSAHAISSGRGQNVPNQTVIPPSTADYWFEVTNDCGTTSSNTMRVTVQ